MMQLHLPHDIFCTLLLQLCQYPKRSNLDKKHLIKRLTDVKKIIHFS